MYTHTCIYIERTNANIYVYAYEKVQAHYRIADTSV